MFRLATKSMTPLRLRCGVLAAASLSNELERVVRSTGLAASRFLFGATLVFEGSAGVESVVGLISE